MPCSSPVRSVRWVCCCALIWPGVIRNARRSPAVLFSPAGPHSPRDILIKGPVVPAVCIVTVIALVAWDREWRWLKSLKPLWGVPLALAIVAPWAIAISLASHGQFYQQSLGDDFAAKLAGGQEEHGAWPGYYLAVLSISFLAGRIVPRPRSRRRHPQARRSVDTFPARLVRRVLGDVRARPDQAAALRAACVSGARDPRRGLGAGSARGKPATLAAGTVLSRSRSNFCSASRHWSSHPSCCRDCTVPVRLGGWSRPRPSRVCSASEPSSRNSGARRSSQPAWPCCPSSRSILQCPQALGRG